MLNRTHSEKYFKDIILEIGGYRDRWYRKWRPGVSFDGLPRFQQVLMAQLRCGECPLMGGYIKKIGPVNNNYMCRWCGNGNESIVHIFADCTNVGLRGLRTTHLAVSVEESKTAPNLIKRPLIVPMLPHRANDVVDFVLKALDLIGINNSYLKVARDIHNAWVGQAV